MNSVCQSPFLQALAWSLVDSLWQMGVLWVLVIWISGNGKRFSSSFRYSLALVALFIGAAGFIADICWNYQGPGREFSLFGDASFTMDYMPLLSGSYLIIASFFVARRIYQYTGSRNLLRETHSLATDASYLIQQLKHITSVTREIKLFCSSSIFTPITTGFLKPVILLPVAAFTQLSTRQIEALVVHEFFHIKRNDYLVNLFTSFVEAFLFFNPFARFLLKNTKHERENCCDDEVIMLGYDRWEYAHALYTLSRNEHQEIPFALAATGNAKHVLLARVRRLLNAGNTGYCLRKPLTIFFLCLFAAGTFTKTVNYKPPVVTLKKTTISETTVTAKPLPRRAGLVSSNPESRSPKTRLESVAKKPANNEPIGLKAPIPPSTTAMPLPTASDENHAFYVSSAGETIAFSMVVAPVSSSAIPAHSNPSQPFLPASTFYCPDHEIIIIVDGKKTISL